MKTITSLLLAIAMFGSLHGGIVESVSEAMLSDESDIVVISRIDARDLSPCGNRELSFSDLLEEQRAARGKVFLLCEAQQSVKGHITGIVYFVQGEEKTRNPHTGIHGFIPDYGTVWIGVASKNKIQNVHGVTAGTFSDVTDGVSKVIDGMVDGEQADDIIADLKMIATYLNEGGHLVVKTKFAQAVADHILKTTVTEGATP